jgi:hypothetical protein
MSSKSGTLLHGHMLNNGGFLISNNPGFERIIILTSVPSNVKEHWTKIMFVLN